MSASREEDRRFEADGRKASGDSLQNSMRRAIRSAAEAVFLLAYLLTSPLLSSLALLWLAGRWIPSHWLQTAPTLTCALLAPVLYPVWLVAILCGCAIENQLHALVLRYRKPERAAEGEGFRSRLHLLYSLCLYQRTRMILTLPLALPLQGVPVIRWLVLLSFSTSARLGTGSVVLGRLSDPDLTEVGDHAVVGAMSLVVAHSITSDSQGRRVLVTAPVTIGRGAVIGGGACIQPGVVIGADAVVEPASYVPAFTRIGDAEVWSGNPARFVRERYRKQPTGNLGVASGPPATSATSTELDASAVDLIATALNRPPQSVTPDVSADTLAAWDSMAQLAMSTLLQSRHGVILTVPEIFRLRSIDDVRRALARQPFTSQSTVD